MGDAPFAPGSISVCLSPVGGSGRSAMRRLIDEATIAEAVGFDGVTLSEHHGGFAHYLPSPMLVAAQLLAHLTDAWAAACPAILPLRRPVIVAEDLAWLAALYPGRVGAGFVAGYQQQDFDAVGADFATRSETFWRGLAELVNALGDSSPVRDDPAVADLGGAGLPVLAGISGPVGARRAARRGAGLLLTSLRSPAETAVLVGAYRDAGGTGPVLLKRRVFLGQGAGGFATSETNWHSRAQPDWLHGDNQALITGSPEEVAESLAASITESGADALNFHLDAYTGVPECVGDQIRRLGSEVLPLVRTALAVSTRAVSR
jgi:alkanesulfonate monooxygenase SsuD/methylene tetrahydromethanopterin reductase-like flavin-dependent oxidoreductase (luciferase family)